ncbi:4-hydroxy-tetrahydrodipicolinate synthase [Corynebacterium kroppenstedtii]|jgi:dihydrodipicolinate synthase|uniref:4-hydroxy-tetrahydrodipicolinate synthase n=1 Tax=Corynebacterium kroppenstedtii TaxID=161879 RepID=A0A2W5UJL4_9CORY|nr:4-hydroxy-tetrahydrodipicolinate synthase [Corynebacterium kroppenstedtii]MDU7287605.1 4-hydroxy-tetrahydrodipicolinate synthase [Corynebacterium kroppenstedtii]PZR03474.1 MAG: 4-hydroxy-tetrahydrodipicolinate synthase [Corynebacterium kroppenstedtii]
MSTGIATRAGAETFGTIAVAMVTPFDSDGHVDISAGVSLAKHLVDQGCDSLVLAGTTGESPTTTVEEKLRLLKAVKQEVGDSARIIAGSGTNNTATSIELSRASAEAGADGLLVVTPYYSKPGQEGIYQHFTAVADAVDVPVMIYDIPSRTVIPVAMETLTRLSEHPRIAAVKDAKGNLAEALELIQSTELAWYSGDDPINLPWLSVGATGLISVVGHIAAPVLRRMYDAYDSGDLPEAQRLSASLSPLYRAQARFGGVSFAKAALHLQGITVGEPRLPQISLSPSQLDELAHDMRKAGVL